MHVHFIPVCEGLVKEDLQLALFLLPRGQCQLPLARQLPSISLKCIVLILDVDDLRVAETALVMLLEDIHVGECESHILP